MTLNEHIALCTQHYETIQFRSFDHRYARLLGNTLYDAAENKGYALALDITVNNTCLFSALMAGASAENIDWVRRKRNIVNMLGISSWAAGLMLASRNTTLDARYGVSIRDYAPFGGSYPIIVAGCGMIGTITVSGAPQRDDHNLLIGSLWSELKLPAEDLVLVPEYQPAPHSG